jgi:uncharacterized protein YdaT
MPWTPEEFRRKHNKKLSLSQAGKAAAQAEAMMREGVDEGTAIATANKNAQSKGLQSLVHKSKSGVK